MSTALVMRDSVFRRGLHSFCQKWIDRSSLVVEIGSYAGEGSQIMAQYCDRLICVDPWHADYGSLIAKGCEDSILREQILDARIDMDRVERAFARRVRWKGYDSSLCELVADHSLDIVYIDAIHDYENVITQISRWWPKLKVGGCLAGHDYDALVWPGVCRAVHERFSAPDDVHEDTSWAVRKTAEDRISLAA